MKYEVLAANKSTEMDKEKDKLNKHIKKENNENIERR